MPEPLQPSIIFDIDFADDESVSAESAAADATDEFQAALESIPCRAQHPDPVVEYCEDEQAVWLRGTVWLPSYDESAARAAIAHMDAWALTLGFDITAHP